MSEFVTPIEKAWATRRLPHYRARKTADRSQRALEAWAEAHGWRCVFLDAVSGRPRVGIIDAVLIRIKPKAKDCLEIKLVQLKSGSAGITASELRRLKESVDMIEAEHLVALVEGDVVHFTPAEP